MNRRSFLKGAAVGAMSAGVAATAFAADFYYPVKVDPGLFETINRVKDATHKSPLEMSHGPVITAPSKVKAGEPFTVEVSIGEKLHPMGQTHWIEYIALNIGNQPAGRIDMQSKGYLRPKASFTVVLSKEDAPGGKVTLIARQRCNLHGLWEAGKAVEVA